MRKPTAAILVLTALTLCGAVLRFAFLGHQSFWIDEVISVAHARAILAHGIPLLPGGTTSWDSTPVHYLLAVGLQLFGDAHLGARFFPALAGTLSIPLCYWLVLQVFRRRSTALLAAALLTVLTIEVAWSRQARAYAFVRFFELAGLGLVFRFLDVPRARTLWSGLSLLVLAVLCHPSAAWAVAAGAVSFCLPPRSFPARWAAALPRPWLRPVVAVAAVAALAAASGLSYHGEALRLFFSFSPSAASYGTMYAGFLVIQLGLLFVLFWVGALIALLTNPSRAGGLLAGAAAYALFISFRTPLFGFRYILPILPVVIVFAAWAVTYPLPARWAAGWRSTAGAALAVLLLAAGISWAHITWLPTGDYWLGYTEPQPPWRDGYAWIEEDYARRSLAPPAAGQLAVVSAFPFMDAEYLRGTPHRRHYLPISHTGLPDSVQSDPPYATAETVRSRRELNRFDGAYVILDDFGLRMLANLRIRERLDATAPTRTFPGGYPLRVWRLGG